MFKTSCKTSMLLLVCSREDNLDVEIAASGFTKEMDESLIEACIVL